MNNKVLVICSSALFPTNSGDKIYSLDQLKTLAKKFDVVFVNVVEEEYDEDLNRNSLKELCSSIYFFKETYINQGVTALKSFASGKPSIVTRSKYLEHITSSLSEIIKREKPMFALVDHLRSSIYLDPKTIKTYLVEHNDEVRIFEQNSKVSYNPVVKITYAILMRLLRKYRDNYYSHVEKVIFISSFDYSEDFKNAVFLKNLMIRFDHKEYTIPNSNSEVKNILFCGSMHWHPNLNGVKWFLENVYEKLGKNINVLIVGRHIPDTLRKYESERIKMFSDVPSMEEFFLKSDIFFVPILTGGGINIKVLEALSYGIPIVTTEFAVRGYDGLNFLEPSNDPDGFANRIENLLNNQDALNQLKNKELEFYKNYTENAERDFLSFLA